MKKVSKGLTPILIFGIISIFVLMTGFSPVPKTAYAEGVSQAELTSELQIRDKFTEEISASEIEETSKVPAVQLSKEELASFDTLITNVENELQENNTDVVAELNRQINHYNDLMATAATEKERKDYQSLIDTYQIAISDYTAIQDGIQQTQPTSGGAQKSSLLPVVDPFGFSRLIAAAGVATAIAWFNSKGYVLASELLTHARSNKSPESVYIPTNKSRVQSASKYNDIVSTTNKTGSVNFERDGSTINDDMFFALHSCVYSKSYSGKAIEIQDRYDFEYDTYQNFIVGVAVNTMVMAQNLGVITPYRIVIDFQTSAPTKNAPIQNLYVGASRYTERVITLGSGEYMEYNIRSSKAGTQLIQTFGSKDAYLYLYSANGSLLASNDDSGYKTNALISYYFNANTTYKIRVKFWSSSQFGEIKLAIVPYYSYSKYEDLYTKKGTSWKLNTYINAYKVDVNTFTPTTTKYYTLKTDKIGSYVDLYMYLIDPRHTMAISNNKNNESYYPSFYDDDSGNNLQPQIKKKLAADVTYFIVVSRFSLSSNKVDYYLRIS